MIELDLKELNEYLGSLVVGSGLVAYAEQVQKERSDVAAGGPYIQVTLSNMHRIPPLHSIHSFTVETFVRAGVHLFDVHVRSAIQDLTRP